MTRSPSPSCQRCYGTARVCRIWGVSRATLYRHSAADGAANEARPPRRRGPLGARSDTDLLVSIQAVIEASPFLGEGYRTRSGARSGPGCASKASGRRRAGFDG